MITMQQPDLRPNPQFDNFELYEDFKYYCEWLDLWITVPKGFTYDGASIPFLAQPLTYTPFHPRIMAAALVHDYLYLIHIVSREDADKIFRDILDANEVPEFTQMIMYKGVSLGGGSHYETSLDDSHQILLLKIICKRRPEYKEYKLPEGVL